MLLDAERANADLHVASCVSAGPAAHLRRGQSTPLAPMLTVDVDTPSVPCRGDSAGAVTATLERMSDELWTARQAAEWMGYTGPNAAAIARAALRRWGIHPINPPRAGHPNHYRPHEVRDAPNRAPGMGHRSDLHPLP